ncbi:MAG: adenylate/guanylate cyclase domain-containing protein, partial [Nitrospinae bacterium]|nr:adenylate/guanylate cyclase domain-containing protein [Nitrospinota bacterium]
KFLNHYLEMFGPLINENGGFIDKFIGDAIMALFPGKNVSSADDSLHAAVAMGKELCSYNIQRVKSVKEAIAIGIGIHLGRLRLGTIGFKDRIETTVIGDTVNLASRVEGLTKQYGLTALFTSHVLEKLKKPELFHTREVDTVKVKGKDIPVTIHEAYNHDSVEMFDKKEKLSDRYGEALSMFKKREWKDALKLFSEFQKELPEDRVVQIYADRCLNLLENPPDDSWSHISTLTEK